MWQLSGQLLYRQWETPPSQTTWVWMKSSGVSFSGCNHLVTSHQNRRTLPNLLFFVWYQWKSFWPFPANTVHWKTQPELKGQLHPESSTTAGQTFHADIRRVQIEAQQLPKFFVFWSRKITPSHFLQLLTLCAQRHALNTFLFSLDLQFYSPLKTAKARMWLQFTQ